MITPHVSLKSHEVYAIVPPEVIFKRYCTNFREVGVKFQSEFRDDKTPSVIVNYYNGSLLYKDFGEFESYRAIDFVMRKYNLNYKKAVELILGDHIHETFSPGTERTIAGNIIQGGQYPGYLLGNRGTSDTGGYTAELHDTSIVSTSKGKRLPIKSRGYNSNDKSFWYDNYGITSKTLKLFNVVPVSHFWIDDVIYKCDSTTYSYEFYYYKGIFRRKIYMPLSTGQRFLNNGGYPVGGEGVLPMSGELLIITKSMKDVMLYHEMGYTAITPPSEKKFLTDAYMEKQQGRFKRVVLNFDNDATGLESARILAMKWNIPYMHMPAGEPKDVSDYRKKHGDTATRQLIKTLLLEIEKP